MCVAASSSSSLSTGAIIGISVGAVALVGIIVGVVFYMKKKRSASEVVYTNIK